MKVQNGEPVVIDIAGAEVSLSAAVITEMFLDRLRAEAALEEPLQLSTAPYVPPIGETWHGGIYAGVARGVDGHGDHHLIVCEQHEGDVKWQAANDWAEKMGLSLPTRRELALCFANVPEIFERAWYWSNERSAGGEAYAWCQDFGNGVQNGSLKDGELRARAVRRVLL